jgi:lipoate-protein ligase B
VADKSVWVVNLGVERYAPAHELQRQLVEAKRAGWPQDVLLLLEHEPVYTLGRQSAASDMLVSDDFLAEQGIPVVPVERGGKVTYHGPGQIVGYPILDLHHFRTDVRWYQRSLAETVIRMLADYRIAGDYDPAYPGVWVNGEKICAFGTMIRRWITFHGWAVNIDPNMEHWGWIIPCGLEGKSVTSLAAALGWPPPAAEVRARLAHHFAAVFDCQLVEVTHADLAMALDEVVAIVP